MKRNILLTGLILLLLLGSRGFASDSLRFGGQLSVYTHFNADNALPWWNGGRYIPQLNYEYRLPQRRLLDAEASLNAYGNAGWNPGDSAAYNGDIKPYRIWLRYSSAQFELRVGLQKINFGSAQILRPLMWFDRIDPRDPLQLTDGVWGALARYYFLNNANIWIWGLYGNEEPKGWEALNTVKSIPEFGGRVQFPVPRGESAFSYHHRVASGKNLSDSTLHDLDLPENRLGFDTRFDWVIGAWLEASWTFYDEDLGPLSHQQTVNLGGDYTFGLGNGLMLRAEQLFASTGHRAFNFDATTTFTLLQASYPIGIFDNLSAIVYYDWTNRNIYNFLNWQRQFNRFTLYIMAYANPKDYRVPTQDAGEVLYAGYGIQLMAVLNH